MTNRLGWNLLSVYTQDCRKMNYRQQKDWMRTYRWLIFGYRAPSNPTDNTLAAMVADWPILLHNTCDRSVDDATGSLCRSRC